MRLGYAQVMTIPPSVRDQDLFLKLQGAARGAKRAVAVRLNVVAVAALLLSGCAALSDGSPGQGDATPVATWRISSPDPALPPAP